MVVHDPAYPNHAHIKESLDLYPEMRDRFLEICDKYGVKIIFCGHEHNYERRIIDSKLNPKVKGTIYQVKNGTCGAPIYKGNTDKRGQIIFKESYCYSIVDVNGSNVKVMVNDQDGQLIDRFSYTK